MDARSTRNSSILDFEKSTPLVLDLIKDQDGVSRYQARRAPGKQEEKVKETYTHAYHLNIYGSSEHPNINNKEQVGKFSQS
jgi:hypothetical protein